MDEYKYYKLTHGAHIYIGLLLHEKDGVGYFKLVNLYKKGITRGGMVTMKGNFGGGMMTEPVMLDAVVSKQMLEVEPMETDAYVKYKKDKEEQEEAIGTGIFLLVIFLIVVVILALAFTIGATSG